VIIYKGHTPSSVCAKSQEVLEVAFAGVLCYTGLTGVTCEVQFLTGLTGHHHRSDRWSTVSSSIWGEKV
jgi:hypothetical protein